MYQCLLGRNSPPPMLFLHLVNEQLEEEMKPVVLDLLGKKSAMAEIGEGSKIDKLNDLFLLSLDT